MKQLFFVEMTDTFGDDANYSWVNRFLVSAKTIRGAMCKVSRETMSSVRKDYDIGDMARYNAIGACICFFVSYADGDEKEQYSRIKEL